MNLISTHPEQIQESGDDFAVVNLHINWLDYCHPFIDLFFVRLLFFMNICQTYFLGGTS